MSEPTLQQMSDTIAEKLLGWRRPTIGVWKTQQGEYMVLESKWQPHNDIAQCFEYIVPALMAIGLQYVLEDQGEQHHFGIWNEIADFWWHSTRGKPSEAIVRAACEYTRAL